MRLVISGCRTPDDEPVATIYEALRLLAAFDWKELYGDGARRLLVHPGRPGVVPVVEGRLSDELPSRTLRKILSDAGLEEL